MRDGTESVGQSQYVANETLSSKETIMAGMLVVVPWNVSSYLKKSRAFVVDPPSKAYQALRKQFPRPRLGRISSAATIVGEDGYILAWVLPNVMGERLQVSIEHYARVNFQC